MLRDVWYESRGRARYCVRARGARIAGGEGGYPWELPSPDIRYMPAHREPSFPIIFNAQHKAHFPRPMHRASLPDPLFLASLVPSGHFGVMQETKKTFAQLNSRGLIEVIDMESGAVLAVQKDPRSGVQELGDALTTHQLSDGTLVKLQAGIDPGVLVHTKSWPFSQMTADLICQKVAEGGKIYKIFKEAGMPPYNIYLHWKRMHPHFARDLEEARKDRAEFLRDKAMEYAEESDEDSAQSSRLKVDTYKWAAGVDDQNRYSPKAKVEGTVSMPVQIVISTGIDRSKLPENNIREVTDANKSLPENSTALPDGPRSAATSSEDYKGSEPTLEVHPISGAPLK